MLNYSLDNLVKKLSFVGMLVFSENSFEKYL